MTKIELRDFLSENQQFWPDDLTAKKVLTFTKEELIEIKEAILCIKENTEFYNFTRIEPPLFKVNGHTLNEYELRQLQVEVKLGKRSHKMFSIQDSKGNWAVMNSDGLISGELEGLDYISNLTIHLLRGNS